MKFAHFRPLVVVFLAMLIGMLLARIVNTIGWWLILIIVGVGGLLIGLLFVPYKSEKFRELIRASRKVLILGFAVILICQPMFFIEKANTTPSFDPVEGRLYRVNGVVDGSVVKADNYIYFDIRNVSATYDFVETKIDEKMWVVVFTTGLASDNKLFKMDAGDNISFRAKIDQTPVIDEAGKVDGFAYVDSVYYSAAVNFDEVTYTEGKKNFIESVSAYVGDILKTGMGERYGGFALAVLLGDRSGIEQDINGYFKDTGVFHLISISGLHVAFIVILLMWVLRRTKLNIKWQTAIAGIILLFYTFLCGFEAPIIRSSLMAIFILIGRCFGEQYDATSSVSLAGILILMFKPLYMFHVGFLLSFAGVFSMFWLTPVFMRLLKRLPKWLASSLAVSMAATLGTLPLTIAYFDYFPIYSLITNMVVVPIFGVVYCALFVLLLVCLLSCWLIPAVVYILKPAEWGFWLVDKGVALFAMLPGAVVPAKLKLGFASMGFYTGMFVASDFCLLNKKPKRITAGTLFAIFGIVLALHQFVNLSVI